MSKSKSISGNNDTSAGTEYTFWREVLDLLSGAMFPLIIQVVFGATIIFFADADTLAIQIIALVFGEGILAAAYVMFGMKNGSVAYTRTVQAGKIRTDNDRPDFKKAGEYAPWKGFVIGFISVLLYLIFHVIYVLFPNSFCEFLLLYIFGWAVYPVRIATNVISPWCMLIAIYPIILHGIMYIVGMKREYKKQEVIRIADEAAAAEFEQMRLEREKRAEEQRAQAQKNKKKK